MIKIEAIPAFNDNYLWLGHQPESAKAFVVDPGDAQPIIDALNQRNLTLTDILITHHHADHIGGVAELKSKFPDLQVFGPATERFKHLVTHSCEDGDIISIQAVDTQYRIVGLPGHTIDHIGFHTEEHVFVGDTLFSVGCGRLFEGTPEQMHASLTKLTNLNSNTLVYCAHEYTLANIEFAECVMTDNADLAEYKRDVTQLRKNRTPSIPTTIAKQLKVNPFLRCHTEQVKKSIYQKFNLTDRPDDQDCFGLLRRWKDEF